MSVPSVVGVGVDVVDVDRMRTALNRTPGLRQRLFSATERDYCEQRKDPIERYAVRFAAKEAVMKAMGLGLWQFPLREIEVLRADSGEPSVRLHDKASGAARERGIDDWRLTLTHSERSAQAIAVALGRSGTSLRVDLFAGDRDRTIGFYEDVLGFVRVSDSDGRARLVLGLIELGVRAGDRRLQSRGEPSGESQGVVELVIEVDDVDLAHERAARHLRRLEPLATEPPDRLAFHLVDPDGVRVKVTSRR